MRTYYTAYVDGEKTMENVGIKALAGYLFTENLMNDNMKDVLDEALMAECDTYALMYEVLFMAAIGYEQNHDLVVMAEGMMDALCRSVEKCMEDRLEYTAPLCGEHVVIERREE